MTDVEIIESAEVPGWPAVFVVGSYDSRITFYSQQVRALNLAAALSATGHLKGKWRFAVVGAGAAGVSLSAALALLRDDAQVDLFEREHDILHLQRGCRRRNLHPHIYDWPTTAASQANAGLPILEWNAGSAHDVCEQVTRQFELIRVQLGARLHLRNLLSVIGIDRVDAEYRISHRDTGGIVASDHYHAVFLTIGFGFERTIAGVPPRSYWNDAGIPDEPKAGGESTTIVISGSGDGGLIDLAAAAVRDFDHSGLIHLITTFPGIGAITETLLEVDREALERGADFDYVAAYDAHIGEWVSNSGIIPMIQRRLRERVSIVFNTTKLVPLSQPTATLNRVAAYLVMKAASAAGHPIEHRVGRFGKTLGTADRHYQIEGVDLEADIVVVRHGPGIAEAFGAFGEIRNAYKAAHERWLSADIERQRAPVLTDDARHRLTRAIAIAQIPVSRQAYAAAVALAPERVSVQRRNGTSDVTWEGALNPSHLVRWWAAAPDRSLVVASVSDPRALGLLAVAIARLASHSGQVKIEGDVAQWTRWLTTLTERSLHARALPLPWTGPLGARAEPAAVIDLEAAASAINQSLDAWILDALNQHLTAFLRDGNEPANRITWIIEPALRTQMLVRWRLWHAALAASPSLLARTLRLATCAVEDDVGDPSDRTVLVGPHRLANILRVMAHALAAAEALDSTAPRADAPGNFDQRDAARAQLATIHASGAELILGEHVAVSAGGHFWTTDYIFLSELEAPLELSRDAAGSLLGHRDGQPRLDARAPSPSVIVGADVQFLRALRGGPAAVVAHLRNAEAASRQDWAQQIDRGGDE